MERALKKEDALVALIGGLVVEPLDIETLKQWARLAAQASTLDLMAVVATVYTACWWHLMAGQASARALEQARAGQQSWAVAWLGSLFLEVSRAAQDWQEVVQRLTTLFGADKRAAWWVRSATASAEQMTALAQQVQETVLTVCATWGLALPKELAGTALSSHPVVGEGVEEEVDVWHD